MLMWLCVFLSNCFLHVFQLFDFEFGYLSHPAQNVGFILMNYYLCYILAKSKGRGESEAGHPGNDLYSKFQQATKSFCR